MIGTQDCNRIVLKVGSALIAPEGNGCSSRYLLSIAHFIVRCRAMGKQVVLVSSGSVAAGRTLFDNEGETTVALKKAMAAAGQMEMMAAWDKLFDFPTAQLLLTQNDLQDHDKYTSIRETIFELLDNNFLPIVNENDAVTTDDSKVGDNDNLSAMIASAVEANALIICSDVNGLYTKDPFKYDDAELIKDVPQIDEAVLNMAGGVSSSVGTGGMRTKLEAAQKATSNGILTFILNGLNESTFNRLIENDNPGTQFLPVSSPISEKEHWLTHTSRAKGELVVSCEAEDQLGDKVFNLDYSDIVDVNGDFGPGDTVLVRNENGQKLAKATSRRSSCLLQFLVSDNTEVDLSVPENMPGPIITEKELAILEDN